MVCAVGIGKGWVCTNGAYRLGRLVGKRKPEGGVKSRGASPPLWMGVWGGRWGGWKRVVVGGGGGGELCEGRRGGEEPSTGGRAGGCGGEWGGGGGGRWGLRRASYGPR
ncbi:hypothetical protein GCM10019016_016310 [Streptomyces prasinosporus]|uniref:Uncharacterized protein n=1 Tax=Streptomyces prasinosporus TaxID=68256 RepID=A0ABP6TJI6_9ACTN